MRQELALETKIPSEAAQESRRIWPEEWSRHWPLIDESLRRIPEFWIDHWTQEYIYEAVMRGVWQAWGFGVEEGNLNVIVLTEVYDMPSRKRFLRVHLAFGNSLDRVLPTIEATMERFAIAAECDFCEIVGREGWERLVPRFKRYNVVLRASVPKQGVH